MFIEQPNSAIKESYPKKIFLLMLICFLMNSCGESNDVLINEFIIEIGPKLPVKASEEMALTAVEPGKDEIFIIYTFSGDGTLITDDYLTEFKLYFLEKIKTQKGKQHYLKRGIKFTYRLENVKGEVFSSFSIEEKDLSSFSK